MSDFDSNYSNLVIKLAFKKKVVKSPPATEEIGAMGHEIGSRQGIGL
jgi:hypothetical protein